MKEEVMAGTAMIRNTGVSPVKEEVMAGTAMLRNTGGTPVLHIAAAARYNEFQYEEAITTGR